MPRRRRRLLPLPLTVLLAATLVACGDDTGESGSGSSSGSSAGAFDGLTIEGEVGSEPEVGFDGEVQADEVESEVVAEGDGEEIQAGDSVLTHLWIGNGFTQEKAFSTYEQKTPQLFTVDEKMLSEFFVQGLEGQQVGSRVAVAASAETAFGEAGNAQLGIANKDSVVAVLDPLTIVPDGPQGQEQDAPSWAPSLQGGDAPTGFDFSGTPEPGDSLRSAYLIEGEGEKVKKGQTIVVDYLGQVYDGKQPFDESFSAQPTSFPIGVGGVVKGWDQTLVGAPVGSRVIMAIPPELGYGDKGNPQAGIKGTDTLYFVVDVLAVS